MTETAQKRRVLVVEDEFLVREAIASVLRDHGFDVLEAADGDKASAILASPEAIDLLLTDIRLPGTIDGWDVGETARRHRPEIPIIYATGYANYHIRRMPGSIFLSKPFRGNAIRDAVAQLGLLSPS